jgi:hypothetical protein
MYAKPTVRPLDAATAVSSCTPCPAKYDSGGDPTYITVSGRYTQVGDYGFCYPAKLGIFSVHLSVRDTVNNVIW